MSTSAKAEQYARELDSARLRGDWTADQHSQSSKVALPWSELTRKFAKHNPERASHAKLATAEQQLKANLHHFYAEAGHTDAVHTGDFRSRISSSDTTRFPPALKKGENGVGWSSEAVSELADTMLEFKGDGRQRFAAISLRALALFALGRDEDAVDLLHRERFMEEAPAAADAAESGDGYFAALVLQGFVVYGMANERLHVAKQEAGYIPFALAGYARAIDLHEAARGGKRANALRGLPADEIERWAETALYRNALLCLRHSDFGHSLNALRAYHAHASRWPTDFRLPQRNVVYRYYLEALNRSAEAGAYTDPPPTPPKSQEDWRSMAYQQSVAATVASRVQVRDFESERIKLDPLARRPSPAFSAKRVTSRTVSKRRPAHHRALRAPSPSWSNEALTLQRSAAASLLKASAFPKAGTINAAVLDFADELIRGWELNGELGGQQADDVVEILYSLVGLTFHSQRIARHLVRLLFAAEAHDEAKRALQAYIQIVEKAREADQGTTAAQVASTQAAAGGDAGRAQTESAASRDAIKDVDDDATYARTLAFGAYAVGRYCGDYTTADSVARKGLKLVDDPKRGLDASLVALVKRVAGSTRAALAVQAEPSRRTELQSEALALLTASIQLDGQSSEAYYALGYLQAETRDIAGAIHSARKAVELEPADVDAWHLLVLLVSAQKRFKDAFRIAEVAIAEAEADDKAAAAASASSTPGPTANGAAAVKGNGAPVPAPALAAATPIASPAVQVDAPSQLLSVDYPPTAAQRSESLLRLMLTYTALEEALDGVESAIEGQRELFAFFHRRFPSAAAAAAAAASAATASSPTAAADAGRPSVDAGLANGHGVRRYGSLTMLGSQPNGAGAAGSASIGRSATTASTSSRMRTFGHRDRTVSTTAAGGKPATLPSAPHFGGEADHADASSSSAASEREAANLRQQTYLLASIWLTSAASFRRAGKLKECRSAIQEAERLQPGLADVWVQLALYFVAAGQPRLATDSLYKALACTGDDVAASVHLARLFLANPEIKPRSAPDSPAAAPRVGSHDAADGRSISTTPRADTSGLGGKKSPFSSAAEASTSVEAQDLSAVSLAEGLLNSVTAGKGWDVAEAWLFLAKAVQRCDRTARARECLEYALTLENTKPVRPLRLALTR
ncbi:uncharacterized protein PSFLO_02760 [Pseudozyma flocculosa]|uniref:TPR-like protein n=1 Tax=Pseudozyma flocculosa TaxID=84751 RepID=A0A5C3F0R5_9BASI|nr:uncharacterized protein PSFLO_02760 [Pseudozyma flocculosa]